MPKGKFVESMISFFAKKSKQHDEKHLSVKRAQPARSQSRGANSGRSILDADSFVFLPAEKVDLYWGAVLNDQNYPISDLAADYSTARAIFTRRQTVGHLTQSEESGLQAVQVLRPRANTQASRPEGISSVKTGNLFSRRLSGTLVKGNKVTDEVQEDSKLVDHALCVSDRERWSEDLSGHCEYDHVYSPTHRPNLTSTPVQDTPHRHSFLHSPPTEQAASPVERRPQKQGKTKSVSVVSHSYFDLEPGRLNSEYDLPWESVDWDRIKRRAWQGSVYLRMCMYVCIGGGVCKTIRLLL